MSGKITRLGHPLSETSGRVSFFGILIAIVLIITAVILVMVVSVVFKKETITMTMLVKDDLGKAVTGAGIYIDNNLVEHTNASGALTYNYTSDKQGQSRHIRAEVADLEAVDTSIILGARPATITLIMPRVLASVTVMATDSLTGAPLSGVDVQIGDEIAGTTDSLGQLLLSGFHLHDSPTFQLKKKKYETKYQYHYVSCKDTALTIALSKVVTAKAVKQVQSPTAFAFIRRETQKIKPLERAPKAEEIRTQTPQKPVDETELVVDTTMPPEASSEADSAFNFMVSGDYRRALDIYSALTAQRRWLARPDFWLYSADCALHVAADANGSYKDVVLDSALKCLDEAERYQNIVEQDYFPALVHLKKGEAWAYKCKMQSSGSIARHEEYCQKALSYLRSAITQMNNLQYTDSDIYRFALRIRDEVQDR
jgi:hypothetical protein